MRWLAVALGTGAGALLATLLALVLSGALAVAGYDDAALAGLTVAVLAGFAVGGYTAGRLAPIAHRFHGALAAMGLAALVLLTAVLGGSPAPTLQVLILAGLAIVLGSFGGTVGGRRQQDRGSPGGRSGL